VKQYAVSLLAALLCISCAASLPYAIDYPLTDQMFRSRDGVFRGRIPRGWFSSADDTLIPAVVAWLVKDDLSAAIGIKELTLDHLSTSRVEKEGLELLAHISAGLHSSEGAAISASPRSFEMKGTKYCSYEVSIGGSFKRIVVFTARGRYYECDAVPVKSTGSPGEIARMFTAQQTLLSSLSF
jgi:hypothetical protein